MNTLASLKRDARITIRRDGPPGSGSCVVYWMQRSQRARDNPALDAAVAVANLLGKPVVVYLSPPAYDQDANLRQVVFMQEGLSDLAEGLQRRGVPFVLRHDSGRGLLRFCDEVRPALVIGDENPLREAEAGRKKLARALRVPFWTVDGDVIVPTRLLLKEQFSARTLRPRIHALLEQFLVPSRNPAARVPWRGKPLPSLALDFDFAAAAKLSRAVEPVSAYTGGAQAGMKLLRRFLREKLAGYPEGRNHPELDATSRLSPYLRFGHLGPHTVALAAREAMASSGKPEFLEQLIVRRELAINFVRFNPHYDSIEGMEPWAHRSFARHANDPRPILYTERQLENAATHDPLWNAAQRQMAATGWMHNYMRMYWAKKILEWSPSVTAALFTAQRLNDRYLLDGRDPNGYAGVAWAILGKHDRAWGERPVFGKIRYMSHASTSRKFDSRKYMEQQGTMPASRPPYPA